MIQPLVSPDLITQHATGSSARSPCTVLASVWSLFSVKRCVLTSNTNTQQSESGSVGDTAEAFPLYIKRH